MTTFALVGYGRWGKNYLNTAKKNPKLQIKYICTKKSITVKDYTTLSDYKSLISFKDIDGVIIASPSSTHYKITKYFLEKGINILVEKPLVLSVEEAIKLEKLSLKKNNLISMVGHIYLYNPAFLAFKKEFKDIRNMKYLEFEGHAWGPVRNDTSALWDWISHDISMVLDLLGIPSAVQGWAVRNTNNKKDNEMVYCSLHYENNLKVFIKSGWLSPIKTRKVIAVGSEKTLIFDDRSTSKLYLLENITGIKQTLPYSNEEPLERELYEFSKSIQKKNKPYTNFNQAVKIIKIIDLLEKSINEEGLLIKIRENI